MKLFFAKKSDMGLVIFGIFIGISFSQLYGNWYFTETEDRSRKEKEPELLEKCENDMDHVDYSQDEEQELFLSLNHSANLTAKPNPRVLLCWVMTSPRTHERRAKYVKQTWGKRCHILVFISTKYDEGLPTIVLSNITEGRVNLWGKTRDAFRYIHKNYGDGVDFFLKADDDTYVIVENLLHLLEQYDPNEGIYLGCEFKGYASGGAGYVLSRAAVKRLVEDGLDNSSICKQGIDGVEDVELGKCLQNLNISIRDSRDESGKHRFLPLRLIDHVNSGRIKKMRYDWFWDYMRYRPIDGPECCSKYPVTFHYIEGEELVAMDHLIYNVLVHPRAQDTL